MYFLIDNSTNVIFGWSAKCGCTHIKNIFNYLINNTTFYNKHHKNQMNYLPNNIENYTVIIFCRNPYSRLVSGYLDKYKKSGEYRYRWVKNILTFELFINELLVNNWEVIDNHHFTQQTSEAFDEEKLLKCKKLYCFDIAKINYSIIEQLFNKKLSNEIINNIGNNNFKKDNEKLEKYIFNEDIDNYINYSFDYKYMYNDELKKKVYKFYEYDFKFFKNLFNLDYTI